VIGTAGTEEGMQAVMQNGASKALNHRQPGYTDSIKVTSQYHVLSYITDFCVQVSL